MSVANCPICLAQKGLLSPDMLQYMDYNVRRDEARNYAGFKNVLSNIASLLPDKRVRDFEYSKSSRQQTVRMEQNSIT